MRHRKYQKVSDLVGKVNQKPDEDLSWYEAMRSSPGLWSYAGFYSVLPEPETVTSVQRKAREAFEKGLAAIR